jgi:hypothetical protein
MDRDRELSFAISSAPVRLAQPRLTTSHEAWASYRLAAYHPIAHAYRQLSARLKKLSKRQSRAARRARPENAGDHEMSEQAANILLPHLLPDSLGRDEIGQDETLPDSRIPPHFRG